MAPKRGKMCATPIPQIFVSGAADSAIKAVYVPFLSRPATMLSSDYTLFFVCLLLLLFFVIRIAQSKLEDEGCEDDVDNDINNRRMLSRFGVWLLVGVCNEPARCKSAERLGRLVSMTLSWIETASTLRRDYVGELLKRLTSQYVCRWLTQVRDSKLDVLCSCLSPNPPAYVKVGGYWDSVSSKVRQHMEGLHRLCCLVPHNLITPEVSGCDSIQFIVQQV